MAKPAGKSTEKELALFEKNYAGDQWIADKFLAQVREKIQDARNNRLELESQWLDDIRLWSCQLDDLGYVGRANVFVPEFHNQVEVTVEKSLATMFQGLDFIKAVAMRETTEDKAKRIQAAVSYELEQKNCIFTKWDDFERQKVLIGTSPWKVRFDNEFSTVYTRDKNGKPIKDSVPLSHGVMWDKVDMFHWYIYPEVATLKTCEMVFEDRLVQKTRLEQDDDLYVNLDKVQEVQMDLKHMWSDIDQLQTVSLAQAVARRRGAVCLTEVWVDFQLTERGGRVPCMAVIANDTTLIRLIRNPYWFQRHPYLAERYIKRPGNIFYGFSLADKLRSLNYQINDLTNHTMDSLSYSLNPIAAIDPALAGDVQSMKMMPGAKWLGSPEGIKFMSFPDVSGSGLRAMSEIRGQISQFSDSSPGIAPQLQGKVRSATQANIVQMAVSQRQQVAAKNEEVNVLIPMCQYTHSMLQQYMEEDWQIKVQGAEKGAWIVQNVKPSDLFGRVEFVWQGAISQEKSAVRSQQLMSFYQLALQVAQMQPGEIDLTVLFKRIAREAFEISDIDDIFKSLRDAKTVDAEVENIALKTVEEVPIHNGDNDDEHIKIHELLLGDKKLSDEAKLIVLNHNEKHVAQKKAKLAVIQMKAQLQAMQAEMGAEPGGGPDGREGPAVPSPMEGQRDQVSASDASVMTGVRATQ